MVDRIRQLSFWNISAAAIASLVLLPVAALVWIAATPADNIWPHLLATTLPRYFANSLILMILVGAIAGLTGTALAWLVALTQFPGRRVYEWALLMPLAVPAYIAAYAMADFMDYAGPLQMVLRAIFGWADSRDYWFPHFRSMFGAVIVLSMAFYPYVYILARAAFRDQSASAFDVASALGSTPVQMFWRVALPMARPAIWAGTAIVMMEVLSDFGAVSYFAVPTLTTGVFSVWTQSNNASGAAQIAGVIMTLILMLVLIEKNARKRQRFHPIGRQQRPPQRLQLRRFHAVLAVLACSIPMLVGFVAPLLVLLGHAVQQSWAGPELLLAAGHTLTLAGIAAVVTVFAGLIFVYSIRQAGRNYHIFLPLTALGYAAPGAVLALGVLIPFGAFDNALADQIRAWTGREIGLILTGTVIALVFAYCVRFFAIAQNSIEAALGRVTPSMDQSARALGQGPGGVLRRVHLPLIRGSVLVAGVLIFVDATKELPATLMLRPFNYETLATLAYNSASLEDIGGAAPSALMVTLAGILPVLLLARTTQYRGRWQ